MTLGIWLTFVAVIISAIGIPWYLRGKLSKVENRQHHLFTGLKVLRRQGESQLTLIGTLITILHDRHALSLEEFK
jgi:NADH:ubiquinone oxidoreductase subunit 2 (subunit N)